MQYGHSTRPKVVHFYADGSNYGKGVRVVIQPNRFRSWETLLEFLTAKFPNLPFGVRSVFSPRGRTGIFSIAELNDDGIYIASDKRHQAKGIRLNERSVLLPDWKAGRVPSGQKLLSYSLKSLQSMDASTDQQANKQANRVIYVHQNGNAFHRHRILLEGQAGNSLQKLLQELSFTLCEPVYKIYTLDGKEIQSVDEVFDGPEEYVAVGLEKFRPLSKVHVDLSSRHHRPPERACVHHGRNSLRHRSAHSGPVKLRSDPTKGLKNQSIPHSQEPKKGDGLRTKGMSSNLHSSQSMLQLSNGRMKDSVPGGSHWLVRITTGLRDTKARAEYTSACTANVFLTVQGTKSTSAALLLSLHQSRSTPDTDGATSPRTKASTNGLSKRDTKPLFSPGQTDEFEVTLGDIGEIVKVRLSHDNTGNYPELLVSHVRMTRLPGAHASMGSGYAKDGIASSSASSHSPTDSNPADCTFYFNAWLSQNLSDGQVTREVASRGSLSLILREQRHLLQETLKRPRRFTPNSPATEVSTLPTAELSQLPTVQYRIRVKTSDLWNAGTAATVMVLLLGQFGDSGPRYLWNRQSARRRPFQQGQSWRVEIEIRKVERLYGDLEDKRKSLGSYESVDDFQIQCVTLGRLNSLKVWLESSLGKAPETWCLEWIQVIEEDDSIGSVSPPTSTIVRQPPALFHGDRWLYSEPVVRDLQMLPVAQPVDRIFGPDGESDYGFPAKISKLWKSMAWIFKNGMEISFYSLVTGSTLSLMACGRVVSSKPIADSLCEVVLTVCTTDYIVTARRQRGFVRSASKRRQRTPSMAQDATKIVLPVFQFALSSRPWLHLMMAEDGSLCVGESTPDTGDSRGFLIRPQLNGFVQLESVPLRGKIDQVVKFRVDPSDGRVFTEETTDYKETLLMPSVKGSMRDQGITMLCTNSEQTLFPRADGQSDGNLVAMATGSRSNESRWRVHRIDRQIRAFESVAHCGHFLQITEERAVDVMGSGDSGCHFVVLRERAQGFIRLESLKFPGLLLRINSNGSVTSSNSSDDRCNRFYPLIVEFGKRRSASCTPPSQPVTLNESTSCEQLAPIARPTSYALGQDTAKLEEQLSNPNATLTSDESETVSERLNSDADWKIQLHTSESAFNALIVLVVYGTRGNSGPIIIGTSDCEKRLFRAGNIDEFRVSLTGIGLIFKIRLEVNAVNGSELPYWALTKVVFENVITQEQILFDFTNRPFIRMFNHCQLSREQIRSNELGRDSLPAEILSSDGLDPRAGLVLYSMKFYARASSKSIQQSHLGPKATLLGRYGDTGRRQIVLTTPFSEQLDDDLEVFECLLEAVYLGPLTHCRIGPIAQSRLEARFCVGIDVVDPMTGEIYRFPANVWIGSDEGGQMKEATLQPEDSSLILSDMHNIADNTDSEYRQLHKSVTQMVQQLTESVSENVRKYNFWQSTLG
ncbi:Oxygen-regulated protein 1 [Taenia crassiceps]|uniref:Oxygen-regulated protein 1 n=1 Tax=Taenia crassiceps TaxID=6207 RepID=A0ABR4Q966_9CEST